MMYIDKGMLDFIDESQRQKVKDDLRKLGEILDEAGKDKEYFIGLPEQQVPCLYFESTSGKYMMDTPDEYLLVSHFATKDHYAAGMALIYAIFGRDMESVSKAKERWIAETDLTKERWRALDSYYGLHNMFRK